MSLKLNTEAVKGSPVDCKGTTDALRRYVGEDDRQTNA